MPYFVYRITTDPAAGRRALEHLDTVEEFKAARQIVRSRRAEAVNDAPETYRMIFSSNQAEAEKLLSAPRDERVIGED